MAVPCRGARRVDAADRQLGDGVPHTGRAGVQHTDDGDHLSLAAGSGNPSSGQGPPYNSLKLSRRWQEAGVVRSMDSMDNTYDNLTSGP